MHKVSSIAWLSKALFEVKAVNVLLLLHKELTHGALKGNASTAPFQRVAELKRPKRVKREYAQLKMEHDLLKKAICFAEE
jgi:transposase-like protein